MARNSAENSFDGEGKGGSSAHFWFRGSNLLTSTSSSSSCYDVVPIVAIYYYYSYCYDDDAEKSYESPIRKSSSACARSIVMLHHQCIDILDDRLGRNLYELLGEEKRGNFPPLYFITDCRAACANRL
jgi:hypothetical protein